MQLHPYLNGGNLWLPSFWPNLPSLQSTAAGISGSSPPAVQALNETNNIHQTALVCPPPVRCSVVKTIGSIDSNKSTHHEPLTQNATPFFCSQLC